MTAIADIDDVMERMCPDKYASEASAGLGVTGRWTGYTESRGQARTSLAGALGWSRGDRTDLWEPRLWAWLVLLAVAPMLRWPALARGLGRGAAALGGLAAAVLLVMLFWTWPSVQVGALARAEPWLAAWSPSLWSPVLAIALLSALAGGRRALAAAPPLVVVGATWAVAGSLGALLWIRPGGDARELVIGVGEALHRATAIDLAAAEAIAGLVIAGGLLGLLAALLGPTLGRAPGRRWIGPGVLVGAGLLVLSRKTLGGAALLAPALALALAAISGLALAASSVTPAPAGRRWLRAADHLLAVAVVLWAAAEAWADRSNPFMAGTLLVGVIAALASLVLLSGPRPVRSPDAGVAKPSQG